MDEESPGPLVPEEMGSPVEPFKRMRDEQVARFDELSDRELIKAIQPYEADSSRRSGV